MIDWISIEDELPKDGERVFVYAGNYRQSQKYHSAVFVKGMSEKDRQLMKDGKIPMEYVSTGSWIEGTHNEYEYSDSPRCNIYSSGDEWGNNEKPYQWEVSPLTLFGQDVTHWGATTPPEDK